MPKNTAPPKEIANVLGSPPLNKAVIPSVCAMAKSLGGKDNTDGEGCLRGLPVLGSKPEDVVCASISLRKDPAETD